MAKISQAELQKYLVKPERSGLPLSERKISREEMLRGVDKANDEAKKVSNEIRERLRGCVA